MLCVTTVSYSIIFNGEHLDFFQLQRGLRQGDPLSPYIFIFLIEALNFLMANVLHLNLVSGIKLSRSYPFLTHLLFADDSLFFLKANVAECDALMNTLHKYCYASGQRINFNKSGIFFSPNTHSSLKVALSNTSRVQILNDLGKYLGLPTSWGSSKKQAFNNNTNRILAKIGG